MKDISRRRFLRRSGAGLAAAPIVAKFGAAPEAAQAGAPGTEGIHELRLVVNGTERRVRIEDRWTLADVLRDHLKLTGTKVGCDRGECGACTVLLNGTAIYACSYLAAWAEGATVQTVEGLARGGALDSLQQAFIDHDAPQCGFCTSGQLMSARALLNRNPRPTEEQVKQGLAGNLCRCSNYNRYVEAVLAASRTTAAPPHQARAGNTPSEPAGSGGR
jgi:xanthine dehydrogenase YagT iron-sulfur-binding subunit